MAGASALSGNVASGGTTPQMTAWNQFQTGENQVANAAAFGRGAPVSTGATYADIGSLANQVMMGMKEDDAVRAANQAEQNAAKGVTNAGIGAAGSVISGLGGLLGGI